MIFSIRRDVAAINAGAIGAVLTNALEFAVAFIAGTVGEGVIPIASLMARDWEDSKVRFAGMRAGIARQ